MKVAIVHDWLTGMRGGERCLEVFCEVFPEADLFTLLHVRGRLSPTVERMHIHTSFVQHLPFAGTEYRRYLPLLPKAVESFDLSRYDLVLSCSHCVAKGARARQGVPHICYCFTPMRYVWDMYDQYFGRRFPHARDGAPARLAAKIVAARLRRWDVATSDRVTRFLAISHNVADRIRRHYGRESDVIHPPVDCSRFQLAPAHWTAGGYYLVFGALVPYKRVDMAIAAARRLKYPVRVAGGGPAERRLKRLAGSSVRFLGSQPEEQVPELYANCRAVLFPGEEDFGIVPLEAMACGRPVVAYGKGGALESVIGLGRSDAPPTGVFFDEQTPESLVAAVEQLEKRAEDFHAEAMRDQALRFDRPLFKSRISAHIDKVLAESRGGGGTR